MLPYFEIVEKSKGKTIGEIKNEFFKKIGKKFKRILEMDWQINCLVAWEFLLNLKPKEQIIKI